MISWFRSEYSELSPYGRFFFSLGGISLAIAAGMTFKFGLTMSVLHALALGVLSVVAAVLPEASYRLGLEGHRPLAIIIAMCALPLLGVEYFSHLGYTVGQRVENTQQTGVNNVKFDDARDSLTSDRTNLDVWRKQLGDLMAANAWAGTVKADGLKAELAPIALAIELETARGGCKSKCQKLMEKSAELSNRIGIAEQAGDLNKRIEATQRIIDKKVAEAKEAKFESSAVDNQNDFVSKLVGMTMTPDAATKEGSQIGISASLALANVMLTPLCFLIAGRSRRPAALEPLPISRPTYTYPRETPVKAKDEPRVRAVSLLEQFRNEGRIAA